MKTRTPLPSCKRPDKLLRNEDCVKQTCQFTSNLPSTVDALPADYVRQQNEALQSRRQLGEVVAEAWNNFQSRHGSFADEYSESLIGKAMK